MRKFYALLVGLILFSQVNAQTASTLLIQNWTNGAWVNSVLKTETRDVNNYLVNTLSAVWNGTSWVNANQYNYTNNSDGTVSEFIYQLWTSGWVNSSRQLYTYNSDGTTSEIVAQVWNSGWTNSERKTYTYTNAGKVLSYTSETWASGVWQNSVFISYAFDSNNFLITETNQNWNTTNSTWINTLQKQYTCDANGNALTMEIFSWYSSDWHSIYRYTYTYNNSGKILTTSLTGLYDKTCTYDNNGFLTLVYFQSHDRNTKSYQITYTNNPDGTVSQILYQDDIGALTNTRLETYSYNITTAVTNRKVDVTLIAYPNPTSDVLHVQINNPKSTEHYTITDVNGRIVLTGLVTGGSTTINLESLTNGDYLLQLGEYNASVKVIKK